MTFDEIYNSIKDNFSPQPRSLLELGVILEKASELQQHERYSDLIDFENYKIALAKSKITVARLLQEIKNLNSDLRGEYYAQSEGVERAIAQLKTYHILSYAPPPENPEFTYLKISGAINGLINYLVDTIRLGVMLTKKKIILDKVDSINSKREKLNYLRTLKINIKQYKETTDKDEYERLNEFISLEIEKWEVFEEAETDSLFFKCGNDLFDFINKIINERLLHNVKFDDGYKVFWRDIKCLNEPKSEEEIQPYIKSMLNFDCEAKGIKITRENIAANGRIDMSFSYLNHTVCVEIKKANHSNIEHAIETQLTEYMHGEKSSFGILIVLWFKSKNGFEFPTTYNTLEQLIEKLNENIPANKYIYSIIGIDCTKPISPSKRNKR